MAGPIGPRALRRGDVSDETLDAKRALLRHALDLCEGNHLEAIGLLAGCSFELAFAAADNAGPPQNTRPRDPWARGPWDVAIGDVILQPTGRLLEALSCAFAEESANFKKWSGEHLLLVQQHLEAAACLFGFAVGDRLAEVTLRGADRDGTPLAREEFDQAKFDRLVRDIHGRALRSQRGHLRGADLVFAAYLQFIGDIAATDDELAEQLADDAARSLRGLAAHIRELAGRNEPMAHASPQE
jgi:hypothetical protein